MRSRLFTIVGSIVTIFLSVLGIQQIYHFGYELHVRLGSQIGSFSATFSVDVVVIVLALLCMGACFTLLGSFCDDPDSSPPKTDEPKS